MEFTINFLSPQAYKNWMNKHKQEDLPKIGLSHDQLFYFSFAHVMNSRLVTCLSLSIIFYIMTVCPSQYSVFFFFFSPLFLELGMIDVVGRFRILFRKLKFTYGALNLSWISLQTRCLSVNISFTKL